MFVPVFHITPAAPASPHHFLRRHPSLPPPTNHTPFPCLFPPLLTPSSYSSLPHHHSHFLPITHSITPHTSFPFLTPSSRHSHSHPSHPIPITHLPIPRTTFPLQTHPYPNPPSITLLRHPLHSFPVSIHRLTPIQIELLLTRRPSPPPSRSCHAPSAPTSRP